MAPGSSIVVGSHMSLVTTTSGPVLVLLGSPGWGPMNVVVDAAYKSTPASGLSGGTSGNVIELCTSGNALTAYATTRTNIGNDEVAVGPFGGIARIHCRSSTRYQLTMVQLNELADPPTERDLRRAGLAGWM